jgi:uncharacterized FlaG/YvyC family protein
MGPVVSPKAAPDLNQTAQKPAPPEPSIAAEAAQRRMAAHQATLRAKTEPNNLQVQLDDNAQRFVQTLTDSNTGEMLRRYPSEAQLAYARAVMAYLRAQLGS